MVFDQSDVHDEADDELHDIVHQMQHVVYVNDETLVICYDTHEVLQVMHVELLLFHLDEVEVLDECDVHEVVENLEHDDLDMYQVSHE